MSGNFPLPFGKVRLSNFVTCVLHVQHDYFSSFRSLFCGVVVAVVVADANKLDSLNKTTAKTTRENNDLIGSMGKNNLDSPATLNLVEFFEEVCQMKR